MNQFRSYFVQSLKALQSKCCKSSRSRGQRSRSQRWRFTYYRTSGIHLMAIHCASAERGGLIKKEKRRKESSWLKLKAFPSGGLITRH